MLDASVSHEQSNTMPPAEEVSDMSGGGFEHLVHLLPTFTLAPDGRIVDPSDTFLRLLGYSHTDSSVKLTIDGVTAAACRTRDREYFRDMLPPLHRTTLIGVDGKPLPVLLLAAPTAEPGYRACLCIEASSESTAPLIGYLLTRQDEERAQIARQLHDTIAQNLAALSMSLSILSGKLPEQPAAGEVLSDCHSLTAECLAQVRALSYSLHPPLLDELGLVSALKSYLEAFSRKTGIPVDFQVDNGFPRLNSKIESRIFGIVQERMSYLAAHEHPVVCRIQLGMDETSVHFEISDDAICAPSQQLTFSTTTILERARQMASPITITPLSHGTTIRAIIARS